MCHPSRAPHSVWMVSIMRLRASELPCMPLAVTSRTQTSDKWITPARAVHLWTQQPPHTHIPTLGIRAQTNTSGILLCAAAIQSQLQCPMGGTLASRRGGRWIRVTPLATPMTHRVL